MNAALVHHSYTHSPVFALICLLVWIEAATLDQQANHLPAHSPASRHAPLPHPHPSLLFVSSNSHTNTLIVGKLNKMVLLEVGGKAQITRDAPKTG